jgi:MFS family permease
MYIIARMLLGVGIVFCIISGSALIAELAYPKERPILTSLFNASYFVGAIIAAAIAIKTVDIVGDWSWRIPSILQICPSLLQIVFVFLLPESPRYLVSKDREDEAFAILVKYHAEGDASSLLVQAEMAQIKSVIHLEMENSKQSWMDMLRTAGMRRRVLISCMLGLFTQMSGNTLLSYYSNVLFKMMGYTTSFAKTRINIANQCWSLINGTIIALFVTRFRRRWMFMLSSTCMLIVFIAMTVSFERLKFAQNHKFVNKQASIAALFFYFAYSPTYNIGNNALTYSKSSTVVCFCSMLTCVLSLPCRTLPLFPAYHGYRNRANFRKARRLFLHQRQSYCSQRHRLEILRHLLWLDHLRVHLCVLILP